jgi:hypothetical protein
MLIFYNGLLRKRKWKEELQRMEVWSMGVGKKCQIPAWLSRQNDVPKKGRFQ